MRWTRWSAPGCRCSVERHNRLRSAYKMILLLPYAIAPAIAGILWAFLFNPAVGPIAHALHAVGIAWNPNLNATDALILVTLAATWKHICYDYIWAMRSVPSLATDRRVGCRSPTATTATQPRGRARAGPSSWLTGEGCCTSGSAC